MEKLYDRIDWHNNTTPAINETNLNKMSKALDDLDDRVILIAGDILVTVPELQEMLEDCTELEQRLEAMTENPPYIGENGHWYIWDTDTGAYVDSGIDASITVEIADITMLEPNATPYVTNTGTDTDPIFHLFIPRGQPGKGISSIAKTGTSGYVDTYTITYTDGTTTTYTVTNGRNTDQVTSMPTATASLVGTIYQYIGASTSSFTHGFYYECQNVNGSYQWVNIPVGNDPVAITSTDPYTYRQSKGNLADMEIVGASVAWNQLVQNGNFANGETNWEYNSYVASHSAANNVATFTPNAQNGQIKQSITRSIAGHKVLVAVSIKMASSNRSGITVAISDSVTATLSKSITATTSWANYASVYNVGSDFKQNFMLYVRDTNVSDFQAINVTNVQLIDLTLLFGSTIADHIYSLEQAQAGSGIAWIKKYGFFSKDYYAYDDGSIQSVCVGSRKVVGFNQWDEEWEVGSISADGTINSSQTTRRTTSYIPVIPNTDYYFSNALKGRYAYYDKDKNTIEANTDGFTNNVNRTPQNAYYVRCTITTAYGTVYKHDICINISDPDRNGTYEPYTETAYPFDPTKELRGLFSLEGGELKANGDIYTADGSITRRYARVNLGSLTWSYDSTYQYFYASISGMKKVSSASTSGDNLVCIKYIGINNVSYKAIPNKCMRKDPNTTNLQIADYDYTDAATFKTAMSGVYLVYELATPTTESAQPYQNPQRAYIDGTEEFIDGLTRDVMIPVGNNSVYQQDKVLPSIEDYVDAVNKIKVDMSAIAPVENRDTASRGYVQDEYFIYTGKFCKAKTTIASGATFTLDTNYEVTTIAAELFALNS